MRFGTYVAIAHDQIDDYSDCLLAFKSLSYAVSENGKTPLVIRGSARSTYTFREPAGCYLDLKEERLMISTDWSSTHVCQGRYHICLCKQ